MRFSSIIASLSLALLTLAGEVPPNDYERFTYLVIRVDPTSSLDPAIVAHGLGFLYVGPVGELGTLGYHQVAQTKEAIRRIATLHRRDGSQTDAQVVESHLSGHPAVQWVEAQVPQKIYLKQATPDVETVGIQKLRKQYDIKDPEFGYQWHILNETPGQIGHDHNISAAWAQGVFGKGSVVAVVDDGLFYKNNDLTDNYIAEGSFDFVRNTADPAPFSESGGHGTACAGEIAGVKNSVCGVGVAYQAKITGIRLLGDAKSNSVITPANQAAGINYKFQLNQIYSNSWGPNDDGKSMDGPSELMNAALLNGVTNGRGGLGSIYTFASGNGGRNGDNCAFDGYSNSIFTIAVGALDRRDAQPTYDENCTGKMITMYSGGDDSAEGLGIATTDWTSTGSGDQCQRKFDGTSAATPLASGIFALVNSIRPDLTYRDYQHLSINSAIVVNATHPSWFKTAVGRMYSPAFGYGKLDAGRTLDMARTWKSVGGAGNVTVIDSGFKAPANTAIPQGGDVRLSVKVTQDIKNQASFLKLEHVTVTVTIDHQRRGDVFINLISPSGVVSPILVGRSQDDDKTGFQAWQLLSVAHWDEEVVGEWTVVVSDKSHPEATGTFKGASIKFYGSAKPGAVPVAPVAVATTTKSGAVGGFVAAGVALLAGFMIVL
ncbi:subtilisin-like protein [Rhizoclosmatium globosum]|uniref:Subtilisin-like protein n=1 Tax=Rhizoclosmatium globosum TaxID=329046 RepID=A0A1Y2AZ53_9FUNG|nr:subtilisin-like protein [Rhizoclosmatium globosum]|eukprot:ORY27859.1 subtilisin-like protein [Rhizoclosmatium globosum]